MDQSTEVTDVQASTWRYIRRNDMLYIVIGIAVTAGAIYLFPALIQIILAVAIFAAIAGFNSVNKRFRNEFSKEFAASIGFAYQESISPPDMLGKISSAGSGRAMTDIMSGTYHGIPTRIFNYQFTVGSGKSAHTNRMTVFEGTFANQVPDIVCRAKSSPMMLEVDFGEYIRLEGDFNQHFSLYVGKGFETEAYQAFPPDVMAALIDKAAQGFTFELNGNALCIYSPTLISTKDGMQKTLDLADYLIALFQKSTRGI